MADPVLGVDMSSTGEVGCIGDNYYEAILKAMLSVGYTIPKKNIMLSTGGMRSKVELVNSCKMLIEKGYQLYATHGTYEFLGLNGIDSIDLAWPDEERPCGEYSKRPFIARTIQRLQHQARRSRF